MIRLEVRDLRLVTAVEEFRTLTRAGQHLHLTQSALSHQLADLERRVGGPLFERVGRRMVPTLIGARLIERGKRALTELRDVERDLEALTTEPRVALRVATECYTCYHWLPPVLSDFAERFPTVDVRIVPEATSNPFRALVDGRIDVAVVSGAVRDRRFRSETLFTDELVLITPPDDALAARAFVQPADLQDRRIFAYSPPETNFSYRDILAPAGVPAARIVPLALTEAIVEMVKAGLGVAILARWAVAPYLGPQLRATRITRGGITRTWRVVTRAARNPAAHVEDFVHAIVRSGKRLVPASEARMRPGRERSA